MKASTDNTEIAAVNAVSAQCARVPRAKPEIIANDKTTSFDGCIKIYSAKEHKKEQLSGEIAVQVKGTTEIKRQPSEPIKYQVEIADLLNFIKVHDGALFFVVCMNENLADPHIYCRRFLHDDVERVTSSLKKKDQQSTVLDFQEFPADIDKTEKFFDDFLKDKNAQKSRLYENEIVSSAEFRQFENENAQQNSDAILCKVPANSSVVIRVSVTYPDSLSKKEPPKTMTLRSGSEKLVTSVTYKEEEQRFICSNGFDIKCDDQNPQLNFKTRGGFQERLASCRLLKALIQTGELFFNDQLVLLLEADESEGLEELEEQINLLTRYASVEDAIHSKFDWDPSDLSDSDFQGLETFAASVLDGKPFSSKKELPILVNLDLGNSRVKMVCKSHGENTYELSDLLCGDYSYSPINPSDNDAPDEPLLMPSMLALSEGDFKTVVNLDCKLFAESLERFPITQEGRSFATLKLLDMLHALDEGAICQQDLQSICEELSDALLAIDESAVAMINCLQVRKRARELDVSEKEQLMQEIASTENFQNKAAAYLLLDDKEGAEFYIAQLSQEDKREFESWPICKFRS